MASADLSPPARPHNRGRQSNHDIIVLWRGDGRIGRFPAALNEPAN
jgi:hypothetical protein